MTKQVQRRRGTATQHTSFTGAEGELSVNTTNKTVHVHDGVTTGGIESARADLDNVSAADILSATGITASVAELNRVDGVTSPIQTQLNAKAPIASPTFTGTVTVPTADINGGTIDGTVIGGATPAAGSFTQANFGDSDKAIFGAGSDLQIYHDGANSYIDDAGTGNLLIRGSGITRLQSYAGEDMVVAVTNGAVNLYNNNAIKLATTATGIDVTGTVTADGLTVDGGTTSEIKVFSNGRVNPTTLSEGSSGAELMVGSANSLTLGTASADRLNIGSNGDISFYEDTGTTPKFFWDSSAERLGIGTVSPETNLHLVDSVGPKIRLSRSDPSVVNGNGLGEISWSVLSETDGGDALLVSAAIQAVAESTFTATNNATALTFSTATSEVATERMRIDAGGNVGIGSTNPTGLLELSAPTGSGTLGLVSTQNTTGAGQKIAFFGANRSDADEEMAYIQGLLTDNNGGAGNVQKGHLAFGTSGTERMRIDSLGNVGINTTSPSAALDVVGDAAVSGIITAGSPADSFPSNDATGAGTALNPNGRISTQVNNNAGLNVGRHTGVGAVAHWYYGGTLVGSVSVTASATAYNTSSDYRLKENITPVQGAADIVKAMRPVTYTFKSDGSWHDGFLAHELQELHPRAVVGEKDAMVDEEYEVTPAVYEDIIIPAVEAVAEVPAVYDDEGVLVSEMVPAVEAQPERTEQQLVSEAVMATRSVPDYQGVDYSKLTPILTAALQEALNKIDALEARLTALEGMAE